MDLRKEKEFAIMRKMFSMKEISSKARGMVWALFTLMDSQFTEGFGFKV